MRYAALLTILLMVVSQTSVYAADICKAIALLNTPDFRRGTYDTGITQYRVNKKTGDTSFCSHGGGCTPTHVFVGGKKTEALRLTNCKVGQIYDPSYDDPDYTIYSVDVVRSANSPNDLRFDDLDNKLLDMGLCSACADNAAQFYLKRPGSRCGQLTRSALEGNPSAAAELREFPNYCDWKY